MAMQSIHDDMLDYGLLFISAALYGATFMLIAVAVETLPPITIVAGRQALAAAIFIAISFGLRQTLPSVISGNFKLWGLIFASALFGNALPFYLTTWGQQRVDAGLAAIIIATMPLITIVLAHFFTEDEKLNTRKLIGLMFGLFGIVILFGPDKLLALGDETVRQYAILGSAMSFAVNMLVMKSLTGLPRYALLAAILGLSFLIVLPFSVLEQPWNLQPTAHSLLAVIGIGILTSAIGNLLSFYILKRRGAIFSAQTNYAIPVMAVFWAWLVLGEIPGLSLYIAMALILLGLAIVRGLPGLRYSKGRALL
ncbi:MAG: DMT family transporter [Pseudomonadota bacterium]